MDDLTPFRGLALALGVGLLIGVERGWRMRGEAAGHRVAGIRTFAILGLLGGVLGLVGTRLGAAAPAVGSLGVVAVLALRSEEHTSELQSLMRISYAVFCLKKKKRTRENK